MSGFPFWLLYTNRQKGLDAREFGRMLITPKPTWYHTEREMQKAEAEAAETAAAHE
jgi:hypothetical protein